jgi:t-SNARE complex subunit (syntaxin)
MGEMYQPTAADYAASNANDALREIRALKERIDKLEKIVGILASRLGDVEEDLNLVDEILDFDRR